MSISCMIKSNNWFTETGTGRAVIRCPDCAAGFHSSFRPRFPLIDFNAVDLRDRYKDQPDSALSIGIDEFPNVLLFGGTNSGAGSGSLTVIFEKVAEYRMKAIKKAQIEQIK